MNRFTGTCRIAIFTTLILLSVSLSTARAAEQLSHRFEKIAEGVYLAFSTIGDLQSNSIIVVNDNDVLLVDSHTDAPGARKLVADIRSITDKPIRFVVNTHYHFDHAGGNEIFGPEVQIVGSEFTRHQLTSNPSGMRTFASFFGSAAKGVAGSQSQRVEGLKQQVASESDPQKKATLQQQIASLEAQITAVRAQIATPSTLVVRDKLVLYRGGREIQFHFLGRGHTGGDLVVYLPKEGIVCTGDLMETGPAYMGDSYPEEWIKTLDALMRLKFNTVLPGHGVAFSGTAKIKVYQNYLRDFWTQAAALKKQATTAEDAAKRIDLTAYIGEFPTIRPGMDVRAVIRAYELMDGKDVY